MTRGKSFGGITAKATMPTISILPTSRSNMTHWTRATNGGALRPRHGHAGCAVNRQARPRLKTRSADLVDVVGVDADAALDRPLGGRGGLRLLVVVGQAFLERFHALGDVAHEVGNLALAAEQQERDRAEQHPMPNAKATHGRLPIPRRPTSRRRRTTSLIANLSARGRKNKLAFDWRATYARNARAAGASVAQCSGRD